MSNSIYGVNELHIGYSDDTSTYVPTYNSLTLITDIAYDNKSAVSVSFDLSGLVATNAVAGTSSKLMSNEYSTDVGFTLSNTGSFRFNSGTIDSNAGKTSRLGAPAALTSGTDLGISVSFGENLVLEDYSSVLLLDPVSEG